MNGLIALTICLLSTWAFAQNRYAGFAGSLVRCPTNETTCFSTMYSLRPVWVDLQTRIIYSAVPIFQAQTSLCNSKSLIFFYIYLVDPATVLLTSHNITCSQYFCSNTTELITNVLANVTTKIAYHSIITNYCYYCNTSDRYSFQANLQQDKCIYFWKHDTSFCNDGSPGENPTLLDTNMAGTLIYVRYRQSITPSLKIDLTNLTDVLTLTAIRNANNDHVLDSSLIFSYMCYCPSMDRFGALCDEATRSWIPFYYSSYDYVVLALKLVFLIIFLFVSFIPVVYARLTSKGDIKERLRKFASDLRIQAAMYFLAAILLNIIGEPLTKMVSVASANLAGNVIIILSYLCIILGFGHLIALWLNVLEAYYSMNSSTGVSTKQKLVLISFYCLVFVIIIAGLIGEIVTFVVDTNKARFVVFALYLSGICFSLFFAISFLISGILMWILVVKTQRVMAVLSMRFSQFMIIVDTAFIHFATWMLIAAVYIYSGGIILGQFLALYVNPFLYLSMYMLLSTIAFLLFQKKEFLGVFSMLIRTKSPVPLSDDAPPTPSSDEN
jgi:hypothetical protein